MKVSNDFRNHNQVQPLRDITQNETNKCTPIDSSGSHDLSHDYKASTIELNPRIKAKFEKISIPAELCPKTSSRSLAREHRECKRKSRKHLDHLKQKLLSTGENNLLSTFKINRSHKNPESLDATPLMNTYDPRFQEESVFGSVNSGGRSTTNYHNSDYNYKHSSKYQESRSSNNNFDDNSDALSEVAQLRQRLTTTEVDYMRWKKYAEMQNDKIVELEVDLCNAKKVMRNIQTCTTKYLGVSVGVDFGE